MCVFLRMSLVLRIPRRFRLFQLEKIQILENIFVLLGISLLLSDTLGGLSTVIAYTRLISFLKPEVTHCWNQANSFRWEGNWEWHHSGQSAPNCHRNVLDLFHDWSCFELRLGTFYPASITDPRSRLGFHELAKVNGALLLISLLVLLNEIL